MPVETMEQALEKVEWYTKRWGIEVFHRTLKSGCKIEDRQLGNDHRIEACLAIDLVVAWRLFHLAKLGRETPDVPCTVFFEEHEWRALVTFHNRVPVAPEASPPTLRDAIRMVAALGGFLGRKGDGEPGNETLWRGIQRLDDLAAMWTIFTNLQNGPTSTVPRRKKYG
ncbi:transposase IS4 family protein [mine drainage metagenome]|uniref:Transposase IS4 family protein n=1 Tax=mine drainage metagenome TaxID=410659 RepID=T1C0U6_9ZZZZ